MKILKSKLFITDYELAKFVNEKKIPKEDILSIAYGGMGYGLFYYAEG